MKNFDGLFKRTTKIVLETTNKEFNVARDIGTTLLAKEEGGKIDYLDPNIVKWFGNITIKGRPTARTLFVYRFIKVIVHDKIIKTAQKFKIYQTYDIRNGIEIVAKLIEMDEVGEGGDGGIFIFLKERYKGFYCVLEVHGNPRWGLAIHVNKLDLDLGYMGYYGAIFN